MNPDCIARCTINSEKFTKKRRRKENGEVDTVVAER